MSSFPSVSRLILVSRGMGSTWLSVFKITFNFTLLITMEKPFRLDITAKFPHLEHVLSVLPGSLFNVSLFLLVFINNYQCSDYCQCIDYTKI